MISMTKDKKRVDKSPQKKWYFLFLQSLKSNVF